MHNIDSNITIISVGHASQYWQNYDSEQQIVDKD